MKIIYIALKYEYGDPKKGFSYEHYNFYDCLRKMNNRQYQVIYFPFDELMIKNGREAINEILIEEVSKEKPDLCFFCISSDEIKKETIREITNKSRTITLNWFTDDHWRFDNFSKYWAPCFNWVLTTDSQAIEKYHKIDYRNVIKTQYACNHFLYKPLNLPKIYDVSFVGQPHDNRKKIMNKLREAGINVECWGRGWPKGRISQEKMINIFSQSKINLNFTKSSNPNLVRSIAGIFLRRLQRGKKKPIRPEDPRYWIDNLKSRINRKRKQIKGRNFEVFGCGGFLLTEDADNLEDYYKDGEEIVIYQNIDDLVKKIRYYLEHNDEREKIALAGYKRTLQEHTYERRFQEIFKKIIKRPLS